MNDFEALQQALDIRGRTVVDIGCGDGAHVRLLRAAGADALGVDIDVSAAKAKDPDGLYLQGGAEALPLADQSVDIAILFKSLHHVPDPHAAFPELHRVVKGQVFIAEPLPTGDFFALLRPVDDETHVRAVAQEAIAAARGFVRERTFDYELSLTITRFEELKDRVLAADPTRAERFAELEPQLREAFSPGIYTIPMRADVLVRASSPST
jgi:ubiquinone/menaquinone biosynthesis C-methylase UbiE